MEVNGKLLNYDRAGNGENVILLLPGALGRYHYKFCFLKRLEKVA